MIHITAIFNVNPFCSRFRGLHVVSASLLLICTCFQLVVVWDSKRIENFYEDPADSGKVSSGKDSNLATAQVDNSYTILTSLKVVLNQLNYQRKVFAGERQNYSS